MLQSQLKIQRDEEMDQFLVSEHSSLTLISFTAKVILNQSLVTHSYLCLKPCEGSPYSCSVYFLGNSVRTCTLNQQVLLSIRMLEKKLAVSSPQLAKTIIMKTLDSHAWSRAWRLLPTVSIQILLNFFGRIVQLILAPLSL